MRQESKFNPWSGGKRGGGGGEGRAEGNRPKMPEPGDTADLRGKGRSSQGSAMAPGLPRLG